MGFRFRKSIKLVKGVRLNLSKKGVGVSAGIPGTGVTWTSSPGRGKAKPAKSGGCGGCGTLMVLGIIGIVILALLVGRLPSPPSQAPSSPPAPVATAPAPVRPPGDPAELVYLTTRNARRYDAATCKMVVEGLTEWHRKGCVLLDGGEPSVPLSEAWPKYAQCEQCKPGGVSDILRGMGKEQAK